MKNFNRDLLIAGLQLRARIAQHDHRWFVGRSGRVEHLHPVHVNHARSEFLAGRILGDTGADHALKNSGHSEDVNPGAARNPCATLTYMPEHTFDGDLVVRWRDVADHARYEFDQWNSVSDRASPAANQALLALKRVLAETMPKTVAEWAVTRWLLTKEDIVACVRAELAEQRPWPSEAAQLRGQMAPPLH